MATENHPPASKCKHVLGARHCVKCGRSNQAIFRLALLEIKLFCLTCNEPEQRIASHIVRLCIDAGISAKLRNGELEQLISEASTD